MSRLVRPLFSGSLLAALALACGSPPAALREVVPRPERASLAALCETVLRDPASPAGAQALGDVLEAWALARRAHPAPPCGGRIDFAEAAENDFAPDYFDALAPARRFAVRDLPRHVRAGAGVALVGVRRNAQRSALERHYPPEAITRAVTALGERARGPDGAERVRVRLLSSLAHEDALVDGVRTPLAADFTAPFAALLGRTDALSRSWLSGLIARQPPREPQLYLLEPYDPRKTPVLMVHGLASTPLSFAPLTNAIWSDAALRRTHQVWHFLYPTSAPFLHPALLLRERLGALRALLAAGGAPEPPPLVVVGHSMGGLIAKTLITDSGDAIWRRVLTQPPLTLRGAPPDVALVDGVLRWSASAHVKRAIFLAVPHHGAALAQSAAGRLGDALAEPPRELAAAYARIELANPGALQPELRRALTRGELTSIDTLSPQHPLLPALAALPFAPWVTVHTVIGDRGQGGPREQSSDGVVPWTSSHLPEAASEAVVPADHGLAGHPDAIAEVLRLLALP